MSQHLDPAGFDAHVPEERRGRHRLGGDAAVQPEGAAIAGSDDALGFVDLTEARGHHRAHVDIGC